MTIDISEILITEAAQNCHQVMEDGAIYSVEQVREAIIAAIPSALTGFLGDTYGIVGDIIEARPLEFNQALGIPYGSVHCGNLDSNNLVQETQCA